MLDYISLDLETTCGADRSLRGPDTIIGMSLVAEKTGVRGIPTGSLPSLTFLIDQGVFRGEPFALQMNADILKLIANKKAPWPIYQPHEWPQVVIRWLNEHATWHYLGFGENKRKVTNFAGKNVANFDLHFLPEEIYSLVDPRVIDVGNQFIDWNRDTLLGMKDCQRVSGLGGSVAHTMYDDAKMNIDVLRTLYPPLQGETVSED